MAVSFISSLNFVEILHQEPHQFRWSYTLESCIRVCSCERGRGAHSFAFLPFNFISGHYAVLNLNEINLFLLLGTPKVMLHECSAYLVISFDTFCDYEVFPHMSKFLWGSEGDGGHVSYDTIANSHVPEVEFASKLELVALILGI